MFKVINQSKEMIILLSGVFIGTPLNSFDHRYVVMGYVYGSNKEVLLGFYTGKEKAKSILLEILNLGVNGSTYCMPEDEWGGK